jgi:hypothetical protein
VCSFSGCSIRGFQVGLGVVRLESYSSHNPCNLSSAPDVLIVCCGSTGWGSISVRSKTATATSALTEKTNEGGTYIFLSSALFEHLTEFDVRNALRYMSKDHLSVACRGQ